MKNILLIFLAVTHLQIWANMAEPVDRGTLSSEPFIGKFVDVLHENIFVKIDDKFGYAEYVIEYHINSSKDGQQIPMLFYASEYLSGFEVFLDGEKIELQKIPANFAPSENAEFNDFSYFFDDNRSYGVSSVFLEYDEDRGFNISLDNMLYFETDITEGEHVIRVKYKATPWRDSHNWVNQYSFRYALSPIEYWKSFGTLDLTIDATGFDKNITLNVGEPNSGSLDGIAKWQFTELPADIFIINYTPQISGTAQFLISISPFGIALIIGLLLMVVHLKFTITYRKKNKTAKFSWVVIVGSLLVPLIFVAIWVLSFTFIDNLIGPQASGNHGYLTFFVSSLYPMITPFYFLFIWLLDRRIKKRLF